MWFGSKLKSQLILPFSLFLLQFMSSLYFLIQFIDLTLLFQLTFTLNIVLLNTVLLVKKISIFK